MKKKTKRIASLGLSALMAFGIAGCAQAKNNDGAPVDSGSGYEDIIEGLDELNAKLDNAFASGDVDGQRQLVDSLIEKLTELVSKAEASSSVTELETLANSYSKALAELEATTQELATLLEETRAYENEIARLEEALAQSQYAVARLNDVLDATTEEKQAALAKLAETNKTLEDAQNSLQTMFDRIQELYDENTQLKDQAASQAEIAQKVEKVKQDVREIKTEFLSVEPGEIADPEVICRKIDEAGETIAEMEGLDQTYAKSVLSDIFGVKQDYFYSVADTAIDNLFTYNNTLKLTSDSESLTDPSVEAHAIGYVDLANAKAATYADAGDIAIMDGAAGTTSVYTPGVGVEDTTPEDLAGMLKSGDIVTKAGLRNRIYRANDLEYSDRTGFTILGDGNDMFAFTLDDNGALETVAETWYVGDNEWVRAYESYEPISQEEFEKQYSYYHDLLEQHRDEAKSDETGSEK